VRYIVVSAPEMIVVHPSLPVKDLKELIALLKTNPGKYSYASPGYGTTPHLACARVYFDRDHDEMREALAPALMNGDYTHELVEDFFQSAERAGPWTRRCSSIPRSCWSMFVRDVLGDSRCRQRGLKALADRSPRILAADTWNMK
jgi:hypothetical protein